ncbi:MAG: 16S rRNA (guanine(966)-N(2))-methyltransferase RsmD [Clostridiales bacterium]|nr:16S rRNA (guanine(966)-N(2))-methyltransferase RsmD [Clostridiales bacterium]
MRIITGSARGAKLLAPQGVENTRPTSDMTKEAVFSMIQFEIEGRRVLDLFAGSGQMGLEALSRGAEKADFVDSSQEAVEVIKANAKKTRLYERCNILCADYKRFLKMKGGLKYDLVFIDPPYYDSEKIDDALSLLLEGDMLEDGAFVFCESQRKEPFSAPGLTLRRHSRYGKAYITLLFKEAAAELPEA